MSQTAKPAQHRPPTELRITVAPGVALHVERRDGDPAAVPFVLLHGLASNLRLWDGVAEALHAQGHTVVALDQRGHGRSDAPDSTYGNDLAVTDLRVVLQALGLPRPVLAGQSWGGNVVLEYGARHAGDVRGLVCVDGGIIELADWYPDWEQCLAAMTPPRLDHLTRAELEARIRAGSPQLPDRAVAAALECFREGPEGRVQPRLALAYHLQIVRSLWEQRPSTRYPTLEPPTLLVLADTGDTRRTAAKRRAEAQALAAAPRLRSHWFSPALHDVHSQYPERVAALLAATVRDGFFA